MRRSRFLLLSGLFACADGMPPRACDSMSPDEVVHVGDSAVHVPCFVSEVLPITLQAVSSDPATADVSAVGGSVTFTGEGVGEALVTITATDANGLTGQLFVRVIVPNRPPKLVRPFRHDANAWSTYRLPLTRYLIDPDRETVEYSAYVTNSAISVDIAGDTLVLTAHERGEFEIEFAATDQRGEQIQHEGVVVTGDPVAYFTQAAQSRRSDVPHIAGRQGLVRLFLETDSVGVATPGATATFVSQAGKTLYSTYLASGASQVPYGISEGDLESSLNALVDGAHIVPGAKSLVIDIDPTSDTELVRRIEMPLDVREVPDLNLTIVPVILGSDSSAIAVAEAMVAQPHTNKYLQHTRHALPIAGFKIRRHEAIVIPEHYALPGLRLLEALGMLRSMEGSRGHYLGLIPQPIGRVRGQAQLSGHLGYSVIDNHVIAHELGHNLNLLHAPCGGPGSVDPDFPHRDGRTGVWGFNFSTNTLTPPDLFDIMGYCPEPGTWIGDYHFKVAADFWSAATSASVNRGREQVLVLRGWIEPNGTPNLEPAFYTEGVPTRFVGDSHLITGRDALGRALFTYRFSPPVFLDGEPGGSAFVHMIPVTWGRTDLASIVLDAGPNGAALVDRDTDKPISIIIGEDGQVRSIVHDSITTPVGTNRVIFTRGLPSAY